MKNLAIIPARSGSRGLQDKNIKLLNAKPLIKYSIDAAIDSECFDTIMVSTDSKSYAKIASELGAEVPFLRSKLTSSDQASSWEVVLEVIDKYSEMGKEYDTFCLLQPTSPLRNGQDIRNAYSIMSENHAISVQSVTELDHPLAWCGKLGDKGSLLGFISREADNRRQCQEKYFRPNGAIYIADIANFRKDSFLYRDGCYAYIMPRERSIDIDTEVDFKLAEFFMNEL